MEPLEAGAVVAGKFRLERPLAKGGMGSVWVARHLQLDLNVALKFMTVDVAKSASGRARFEREAKAAAHLQSPHVVSVLDYGVDGEIPYMVMELLKGEDLETRLRRTKRLPLPELLTLLTQAAKGLRRAHEAGIVHRDLKPRNIFLVHGPEDEEILLKILDFGIAKEMTKVLVDDSTSTGQVIGSPNYMSPEQIRAVKDIDYRTDLWSLGVIVFQAATGRLPFWGEAIGDVFAKILVDPIPVATSICPDLPPSIDAFFEHALARDPLKRFPSTREMAAAFAEVVNPSMPPRDSRWSHPGDTRRHRPNSEAIILPEEPSAETTTQVKQRAPAQTPLPSSAPSSSTIRLDPEESETASTGGTLSRPATIDAPTLVRHPSKWKRVAVIGLALVSAVGGSLLIIRPPWLIAGLGLISGSSPGPSTAPGEADRGTEVAMPAAPQVIPTSTATSQASPDDGATTPKKPGSANDKQGPKETKDPRAPTSVAKSPARPPNTQKPATEPAKPASPPPTAVSEAAPPPATAAPAQGPPPAPTEAPKTSPAPTHDPMKLGF
ncbi:MAG TPA: protein kinase [Polyangiaceae bacterium]|nr:protein kinase [Polyangiaceae bacterium]